MNNNVSIVSKENAEYTKECIEKRLEYIQKEWEKEVNSLVDTINHYLENLKIQGSISEQHWNIYNLSQKIINQKDRLNELYTENKKLQCILHLLDGELKYKDEL